jgi:hypothetical protein
MPPTPRLNLILTPPDLAAAQIFPGPRMTEQTGAYISFQAEKKLLAKIARQGKVAPLITKGGLKSDGHNLSIGLKSGPVGATIQIAK